jgi:DNA-binding transcriptional ArsR family regulator
MMCTLYLYNTKINVTLSQSICDKYHCLGRLTQNNIPYIAIFACAYIAILPMNNPQLTQEVSRLHADICSALADPNRILMIYALADQPRSVNELCAELGISQPATSRNLKILRERGLVYTVRQGNTLEYHLTDDRLVEALNMLRTVLRDSLTYRANLMDSTSETSQEIEDL